MMEISPRPVSTEQSLLRDAYVNNNSLRLRVVNSYDFDGATHYEVVLESLDDELEKSISAWAKRVKDQGD